MKKETQIHIRVSNEQKQAIKDKADNMGVSVSEYILKRVLSTNHPVKPTKDNLF